MSDYRTRVVPRRKKYREAGLCIDCGRETVEGKTRCQHHLKKDSERSARKRRKYYEQGRCMCCGHEFDDRLLHNQKHKCTKCVMVDERSRILREG